MVEANDIERGYRDNPRRVTVSIVSHLQGELIVRLLDNLREICDPSTIEVILTINLPEACPIAIDHYPFAVKIIHNKTPKGFAENHNAAFRTCQSTYFSVINPDVLFAGDPFPRLLEMFDDEQTGVVAPLVVDAEGIIQDNARRHITPKSIATRILKPGVRDYAIEGEAINPDWVAGMMLVFSSSTYAEVGGFDEGYFMYCEDADICARLRQGGHSIVLTPWASAIHDARRDSHKRFKHLMWHLASLIRFLITHPRSP